MVNVKKIFAILFMVLTCISLFGFITLAYSYGLTESNSIQTLELDSRINFTTPTDGYLYLRTENRFSIVGEIFEYNYTLFDEDGSVLHNASFEEYDPGQEVNTRRFVYKINFKVIKDTDYAIEVSSNNADISSDLLYMKNSYQEFALNLASVQASDLENSSFIYIAFIANIFLGIPWLIMMICFFKMAKK